MKTVHEAAWARSDEKNPWKASLVVDGPIGALSSKLVDSSGIFAWMAEKKERVIRGTISSQSFQKDTSRHLIFQ